MKAMQVVARGQAQLIEIPKPEVKPGHVLVRASRLSLCGSDIRILHHAPEASCPLPRASTSDLADVGAPQRTDSGG
jgi:threonine dehydrogenase-like Zn-dependent dehydrogenase